MKLFNWLKIRVLIPAYVVILSAVALLMLFTFLIVGVFFNDEEVHIFQTRFDKKAPLSNVVKEVVSPLQYSGIPSLLRDNVKVSLDFKEQVWVLSNKRVYDVEGKLTLDDGKFGLCGELAAHTFNKIRDPFLKAGYDVRIASVYESSYFNDQKTPSHFILTVAKDKSTPYQAQYLIDPSFKRYGEAPLFEDYVIKHVFDPEEFIKNLDKDAYYRVGRMTPVWIQKKQVVLFGFNRQNEIFDSKNFSMALTSISKYKYAQRPIFVIYRNDNKTYIGHNASRGQELFGRERYFLIRDKLIHIYLSLLGPQEKLQPHMQPEALMKRAVDFYF